MDGNHGQWIADPPSGKLVYYYLGHKNNQIFLKNLLIQSVKDVT